MKSEKVKQMVTMANLNIHQGIPYNISEDVPVKKFVIRDEVVFAIDEADESHEFKNLNHLILFINQHRDENHCLLDQDIHDNVNLANQKISDGEKFTMYGKKVISFEITPLLVLAQFKDGTTISLDFYSYQRFLEFALKQ